MRRDSERAKARTVRRPRSHRLIRSGPPRWKYPTAVGDQQPSHGIAHRLGIHGRSVLVDEQSHRRAPPRSPANALGCRSAGSMPAPVDERHPSDARSSGWASRTANSPRRLLRPYSRMGWGSSRSVAKGCWPANTRSVDSAMSLRFLSRHARATEAAVLDVGELRGLRGLLAAHGVREGRSMHDGVDTVHVEGQTRGPPGREGRT